MPTPPKTAQAAATGGLRLGVVRSERRAAAVEYAGTTVEFVYYPGRYTLALTDTLESTNDVAAVGGVLEALLESWEVYDENDKPLAPTAENMRDLPGAFIMAVANKIIEGANPPAEGD